MSGLFIDVAIDDAIRNNAELAQKLDVPESLLPRLRRSLEHGYRDGGFKVFNVSDKARPRELAPGQDSFEVKLEATAANGDPVVQTLTSNFPEVSRVRLVVNGAPAETLGGHLSLMRSFAPIPGLSEPAAR